MNNDEKNESFQHGKKKKNCCANNSGVCTRSLINLKCKIIGGHKRKLL